MSVLCYNLAVDNCDVGVQIIKIFWPVRSRGVVKAITIAAECQELGSWIYHILQRADNSKVKFINIAEQRVVGVIFGHLESRSCLFSGLTWPLQGVLVNFQQFQLVFHKTSSLSDSLEKQWWQNFLTRTAAITSQNIGLMVSVAKRHMDELDRYSIWRCNQRTLVC